MQVSEGTFSHVEFICHLLNFSCKGKRLTLVLLNPDIPCFANSVDPDQLASEEAN